MISRIEQILISLQESNETIALALGHISTRLVAADEFEKAAKKTDRRHRRLLVLSLAGLVLDLILSAALIVSNDDLRDTQKQVQFNSNRTSNEVLCPLYGLFLQAVEHPRPDQIDTPEKRKLFEAAAKTIKHSYEVLDCATAQHRQ